MTQLQKGGDIVRGKNVTKLKMSTKTSTKETIYPFILLISFTVLITLWLVPNNIFDGFSVPKKSILSHIQEDIHRTNEVHILLSLDEHDMIPMFVLINSIIKNEKYVERLQFHILVKEDISIYMNKLPKHLSDIHIEFQSIIDYPDCIKFYENTLQFVSNETLIAYTNNLMNFARFCIPHIFCNISDGIYLDVDMIVQESVSKLYDEYYFKHDYIAWSVMNRNAKRDLRKMLKKPYIRFVNDYLNHNLSLKYPSIASEPIPFKNMTSTFNAGILMLNLTEWRRLNLTEQSMELFKIGKMCENEFGEYPWRGFTQSIMNLLFIINEKEVGGLDEGWNFIVHDHMECGACGKYGICNPYSSNAELLKDANIIHWSGPCKPFINESAPGSNLWKKYDKNK